MTTGRGLISKALNNIGALTKFDDLSSDEAADGLEDLNALAGMWASEGLLCYARSTESFSISPSDGEYTIGSGGDFNTTVPMAIIEAFIREGQEDYVLTVTTDEEYARIFEKSELNIPTYLNFTNGYPLATIKLWPVPVTSYTLHLLSEKPLSQFTLDGTVTLPPGWGIALWSNLAVILAPQYGQPVSNELFKLATDSKAAIRRAIAKVRTMDVTPDVFVKLNPYYDEINSI